MGDFRYWFISRQKRQLPLILPSLICFSDICEGEVWSGNHDLQLRLEDALDERGIVKHGSLRARETKEGGGGVRTLYTQLNDLGLVFVETQTKKIRLTLIGEAIVKGDVTLVEAMRIQLARYQYPSATRWDGPGSVNHGIKIHPFLFLFRLLMDDRLNKYITADEMKLIIIHEAHSESTRCYESIVNSILEFRETGVNKNGITDTPTKTYAEIANTFFNYMELTQYVDRGVKSIVVRSGKEDDINALLSAPSRFIQHPEVKENYQRAFGVGLSTKDLRSFTKGRTRAEIEEARIKSEYVQLRASMPILQIDEEVVEIISERTGIRDSTVEAFLKRAFPRENVDDFFLNYRDYAHGGRKFSAEFEQATVAVFRKIFGMTAKHVGPIGNTPDVFVESEQEKCCGIIDNKAYSKAYSITGDHKRRMIDEYIPNVRTYAGAKYPLAFFSYLSPGFGKNINNQLKAITDVTGVNGSAMPIDLMIDFAQDYKEKGYTHKQVIDVFSVNRQVSISDL